MHEIAIVVHVVVVAVAVDIVVVSCETRPLWRSKPEATSVNHKPRGLFVSRSFAANRDFGNRVLVGTRKPPSLHFALSR